MFVYTEKENEVLYYTNVRKQDKISTCIMGDSPQKSPNPVFGVGLGSAAGKFWPRTYITVSHSSQINSAYFLW